MKVNHIGYLVKDINKSVQIFQSLGYVKESEIYRDNYVQGGGGTKQETSIYAS